MDSKAARKPGRRRFILGGLGVTGALIVGWGVLPPRQRLNVANPIPAQDGQVALNGWLRIDKDGQVMLAMPRSEMGQGVHTALPMLVAEELDVPLSMVRIEQAPLDKIFGNVATMADSLPFHPDDHSMLKRTAVWLTAKSARELGLNITGGSSSIKDMWGPMRFAGAAARGMLVQAAAKSWGVTMAQCHSAEGFVTHPSGRRAGYGELAALAAGTTPPPITMKDPQDFRLIGTPQLRRDTAAKIDGSAVFGLDVRPAGLVFAAVKMSPTIGGSVKSFDATAVKAMPGVIKVLDYSKAAGDAPGVAVIAKSWWQAKQAVASLPVVWEAGPNAALSTEAVFAELTAKLDSEAGFTYYSVGDLAVAAGAAKTVKAEYRAPFLAHAAMEPINCTVRIKDGRVTVWCPTQSPGLVVDEVARIAGVALAQVTLHVTYLGGGFGRRLEVDMARQAAAIALAADGAPVQVIWTREEDMAHDMYRPAALARFSAALDAQGKVLAWDNKSAAGSVIHQVVPRVFGLPGMGPDKTTAEGEFDMPYEFPNQRIAHVIVPTAVPIGFWRSVGHSHNAFFKESFVDEVAHAAGADPVAFRRSLLRAHPRHLAVLDAAVAKAGSAAAGRAFGVALHQSFGSIVAQVAEVSVAAGVITVHRVVCAIDCGMAVNPNIIAQQMESAVVFGLSAALFGEVTVLGGRVQQSNFHDYPVVRMHQAPDVETMIIASAEAPEGVGEPGVPPVAPAVANAVFALTGKRLRSLPLRLA